jgi:hypothetical protein
MPEALQIQTPTRRSLSFFLIAGFWFVTALLTLFVGVFNDFLAYEIIGILTMIMVTGLINGSRLSFWISAIFPAFNFGMRMLQLQISSWRLGESEALVWSSLLLSLTILILHQFNSVLRWFEIPPTKKHRTIFLLTMGLAILAGQYLLPTLRALSHRAVSMSNLPQLTCNVSKLQKIKRPVKERPDDDSVSIYLEPKLICEVSFATKTKDGILREPVFLRLRPDLAFTSVPETT